MTGAVTVVPLTRAQAQAFVRERHRHHRAHVSDLWRLGLAVDGVLVAVAVVEQPKAQALVGVGLVFEVSRLAAVAPVAVNASSRLYSACARAAFAMGYRRGVTYTRHDEAGTSLRAAGWWPTALVKAESRERRQAQMGKPWLPGFYQPGSEAVDRVRWECGPDAAPELDELRRLGRRAQKETAA